MHFFERCFEALAAYPIHREKGKCLRQWYAIRAGVQKLNVRIHFPKNRTENQLPQCPSGIGPFASRADPPVSDSRCTTPTSLSLSTVKIAFC